MWRLIKGTYWEQTKRNSWWGQTFYPWLFLINGWSQGITHNCCLLLWLTAWLLASVARTHPSRPAYRQQQQQQQQPDDTLFVNQSGASLAARLGVGQRAEIYDTSIEMREKSCGKSYVPWYVDERRKRQTTNSSRYLHNDCSSRLRKVLELRGSRRVPAEKLRNKYSLKTRTCNGTTDAMVYDMLRLPRNDANVADSDLFAD